MTEIQKIRPSQFILSYGPGAILEGTDRPYIILDAYNGLFGDYDPEPYAIDDSRISNLLNARIYRLPTDRRYRTMPFPKWSLCVASHGPNRDYVLYDGGLCPVCRSDQGMHSPIRFVLACNEGHLDEVPWYYSVHKGAGCTSNSQDNNKNVTAFYWRRTGNTMKDITIICTKCEKSENFGKMYYNLHPCYGRHPHKKPPSKERARSTEHCKACAKIITRQSTILHVADTTTLMYISPTYTALHRLLSNRAIFGIVSVLEGIGLSKEAFDKSIKNLNQRKGISDSAAKEIMSADWDDVHDAINTVYGDVPDTYLGLIRDEFNVLIKASKVGAPPQRYKQNVATPGSKYARILFEVDPNRIKYPINSNGIEFRITPIQTLRTVTVQEKFHREIFGNDVNNPPKSVDVSFNYDGTRWYPGVEYVGEGIFIRLDNDDGWETNHGDTASSKWREAFNNRAHIDGYPDYVFKNVAREDAVDPGFVWWHTLSHLLIRIIGEESGYSSAAIRERVYFERNNDKFRGGILLYAAQPGSEGTMGGLIGISHVMKQILDKAFAASESCSSDPLCANQGIVGGGYNGASCYACLLISETSCEHRNMWLDRNVLNGERRV